MKSLRSQSNKASRDTEGTLKSKASSRDLRTHIQHHEEGVSTATRGVRTRPSRAELKPQSSKKDLRSRPTQYALDVQGTQGRARKHRIRDRPSESDDDEQADYGQFVSRRDLGMGLDGAELNQFATDESTEMHLRFRRLGEFGVSRRIRSIY